MSKIFIKNKYAKIYLSLVKKAKERSKDDSTYYERHHIFPKSLFPKYSNLKKHSWNGVLFTGREHYVAHLLLIKMTSGTARRKMVFALKAMRMNKFNARHSSKMYEFYKKEISRAISDNNTGHTWNKGIPKSKEHRENLSKSFRESTKHRESSINNFKIASQSNKGKSRPDHLKRQWSEKHKGKKFSDEAKLKMKDAAKKRSANRVCCVGCHQELPVNSIYSHLRYCN